jgi:hypothetical protein
MANREVARNKTLEQQRVIINQVAADVGDVSTLNTSDKSSVTNAVNELKLSASKVANAVDTTSTTDISIPFLADTSAATTLKYNPNITFQPSTNTFKTRNIRINDTAGKVTLPEGTSESPSLTFESAGRTAVGLYRKNDSVGVGFAGRNPQIFFNADGTISSAGVKTANASELALTNNPKCLYVSEQEYYASDSWTNNGLSLNKPFKSITRALLEAARQSYVGDTSTEKNNDKFEYFTIIIFPGNYEIDNRPGRSLSVENAIDFFSNRNNYGPTGKVGSVVPANLVTSTTSSFVYNQSTITVASAANIVAGLRVVGPGIPDNCFVKSNYVSGTSIPLVDSVGSDLPTTGAQTNVTIEFYQSVSLRAAANYTNVSATGGSGSLATFDVQFTSTEIIVKANNLGSAYFANELLTIPSASLGDTGALQILITSLYDDSEVAITQNLYLLNPPSGGVIVPRGTSLVGLDLRKTVVRPKYIPDPTIPPSGNQRNQDASDLIKANREYIQSEAFGYLQSKKTLKAISAITNGATFSTAPTVFEPDVFTCTGHGFVENTPVKFVNIPTNTTLQTNAVYYVEYIDANSFRIKKTKTGAPLSDVRTATAVTIGSLSVYSFNVGSESCRRDIGYFIDSLAYDLSRGGNSKLYDNAEYYVTGKSTQLIKGDTEIRDTLNCLRYATNLAASAVRNHEFSAKGSASGTTLTLTNSQFGITEGMIVTASGIGGTVKVSSITYPTNRNTDAANLILKNKELIADVAVGRMKAFYPAFTIPNGDQNCKDDIKAVIETIAYNLANGGNDKVYDAAKLYVDNTYLVGEEVQSVYAFNQARDLAIEAMRNVTITINGYSTLSQIKDLTLIADPATGSNTSASSCANTASAITTLFGIITTAITVDTMTSFTRIVGTATGPTTNGAVATLTLDTNVGTLTNVDFTFSAKNTYKYGFVSPYYDSKFDSYPNFDNTYLASSGTTTECQAVSESLFTLYSIFSTILNNPGSYILSTVVDDAGNEIYNPNYVQKSYPYGYDRDLETAIFRVTGGCYFWQMTFKDGSSTNMPYYVDAAGNLTQYTQLTGEPSDVQKETYRVLSENRTLIINTVYNALLAQYPSFTYGYATTGNTAVDTAAINALKAKCKRDIGYIFDAVACDLYDGGNANIYDSVLFYFNATKTALSTVGLAGETAESIWAFNLLSTQMQALVVDTTLKIKIQTEIGYLTTALTTQVVTNLPTRSENNNVGQFPCSHHKLVTFKFAGKQELKDYYDKIEAVYNANFDPDIPAVSTATVSSITNDTTGDIFSTDLAHGFAENTPVKFRPYVNSNIKLNQYKTYYVKYINTNKFKLKKALSIIPYVSNQAADAYNAIMNNLSYIANEAYYAINATTPITIPSNSTAADCLDDVVDVLKCIAYNVKYGYNNKAWEAGNVYASGQYVSTNKTATINVLNKARDAAIAAMRATGSSLDATSRIAFTRSFSSISRAGNGVVTVNTTNAHGLAAGDKIVITASNTNFNTTDASPATVLASGLTATSFTYNSTSILIPAGATGTFRKADSTQVYDSALIVDSSPAKCASIASAITTLFQIVTTAITNDNMNHVAITVPPITPTEDSEEVLTNIVSGTVSSISINVYDLDAYSQRKEENQIVGDATKNTTIDTVSSASPYIFNCSLRSVYGMSGLHANGEDTTGFKSMVLAQYTGISLQRDNRAFTRLNFLNGLTSNKINSADNRFTKVDSEYIDYWRNYHVKASNDGFLQVVSVFAVGFADHFISDTGSDISITNSNSNFGNIATLSIGYKATAFAQDTRGQIVGIIPPKGIDYSKTNAVILDEIDYRTITKWNESRIINGGIGENRFGKIYIKSTDVNGLYTKDGLPEYTDPDGNKWLLIDGVNYLLGKGKNIAYKSNGDYETTSVQKEYVYGSFTKFNGSTEQGEYRSRLRDRNPSNPLDCQTSYETLITTKTVTYSNTSSTITVPDATGITAGQKITSSLPGIPTNTYVSSSYVSGTTIPLVNASGVSVNTTAAQTDALIKFFRIISIPENARRQFYGWEYSETSGGIDLGSLVIYIDEYVMYDDVFYHNDYKTIVQNRANLAGQTAVFPGSGVVSTGAINPSGDTVSGIPLNYNDSYNYAYGNILKRILQRYDSDVNYTLNTTDSLEYEPGSTIANGYLKRVSDTRLSKDHIWRFVYKIPKESNAKPPERKYVIQVLSENAPVYTKSYYIYDVETVDEYIADEQDGIYYLTVLDSNVKNIRSSTNSLKYGYSQNQYFLYPEVDLDKPEWNPKEAVSVYDNNVKIRTVVLDDTNIDADNYERVTSYSITGELTKNFVNYITDSNARQASLPSSSLLPSTSNYKFSDIKQVYLTPSYNTIGVNKEVFSGSNLSDRIVKFKRSCSASPNNTELLNVTDIEKLTVGAELTTISASGGTIPTGVTITITSIDIEQRKVTLSASITISTTTVYTYTFNNPIFIKIHRPSNIRASGHTWEYVGYGPGNYSTAFPVFQTIVLNRQQIINSQTIERNGGFNGSSGTNSNGDFFIGTQVIDTKGSQSETVNVPKLKTSAQNRLIDPTDLLFITAASSSGTGNLSAFSENLQNTVRTQLSDQSSKTVTYDKVTVANLEVGTNIKISGSIDIRNSNMNAVDSQLLFPKFSGDGKKYGFAKRVDTETVNWTASRLALPDDGFVTARDLGEWAYINRVTGSSLAQVWSTLQDGQYLYAAKTEGVTRSYTFQYGTNFTYTPTSAQMNTVDFYLKIGKIPTSILTENQGLSGFIYVNVAGISTAFPTIKGLDPLDVNGGVEWRALKNAWLNPETSETGVSGNFVISYYIYSPSLIIYNVNPFEV